MGAFPMRDLFIQYYNGDFRTAFTHAFGFDFNRAAAHFGVTKRTVLNWYDANRAPQYIVLHVIFVARGYLPDYFPFNEWHIVGTDIHTPYGVISAFEVEFTKRYFWLARESTRQLKTHRSLNSDLHETIDRILAEVSSLETRYKLAK